MTSRNVWAFTGGRLRLPAPTCALRELEQSNHEKARIQIFKVLYLILCEPIYIENPNYAYRIDMYKTKLENVIIHEEDESPYAVKERINIMCINMKLN